MKEQRVQIKFPAFAEDEELDIISKSIDCKIFLPEETLKKFIFKLRKIDSSLSKTPSSLHETIEKKKELVQNLSNKCESLKQRNAVISFAEEAEEIANSSPLLSNESVSELIADLKARIETYVEETRPSRTNMKFLRFAKKLLEKAAKHEPVLIKSNTKENIIKFKENVPAEISLEDFALAESLYELAATLYQETEDAFNSSLENNFSENNKKEISFHISICNGFLGKLKTKEDKDRVIQGILGYAHTLTDYYAGITPYPSIDEIEAMFSEQIY